MNLRVTRDVPAPLVDPPPTTPPSTCPAGLDVSPPTWCWSRLVATHEGMLTYATPRRRVSLPVPYAVDDRNILIALAPNNDVGWRAAGMEAALVITGVHDGLRWSVRALGRASRTQADEHGALLLASSRDRPRLRYESPPQQLRLTGLTVCRDDEAPTTDIAGCGDLP